MAFKAMDKWLLPYLKGAMNRPVVTSGPVHVLFAVCDHYEPLSPHAAKPVEVGDARVGRWLDEWPRLAAAFSDADGCHPRHTIFYPAEGAEKPERYVPMLKPLCDAGWAEMEFHLHHDNDTAESLERLLVEFRDFLHGQNLLGVAADGPPAYGFIHGDWALCNSRPDGRKCGVNEEIDILLKTGCYADFTFPSIPSPTQPSNWCNTIYLAKNLPGRPRSHDEGRRASVGCKPKPEELLLIQGPAALNWKWRKKGILPRIEHADLCATNPPSPPRADLWVRQHIYVAGRPEWIFIKLHAHGCIEGTAAALLGDAMRGTLQHLCDHYNDGTRHSLHFVTAREMHNIARAAIDGQTGNPGHYRDYAIRKAPMTAAI